MSKLPTAAAPKMPTPAPNKANAARAPSPFDARQRTGERGDGRDAGRDRSDMVADILDRRSFGGSGHAGADAPDSGSIRNARFADVGVRQSASPNILRRPMQRRSQDTGADPEPAVMHRVAAAGVAGSGRRLPHFQHIQRAFGDHDLSRVQAHVGGPAALASRAINAQAYALGERIAFAQSPTLHTAAHEAAHVVQQRRGVSLPMGIGRAGDRYEEHANRVADRVVAGHSAADLLDPAPAAGSGPARLQRLAEEIHQPADKQTTIRGTDSTGAAVEARATESDGTAAIVESITKGSAPSPDAKTISREGSRIFEKRLIAGHMLSQALGGKGTQDNITAMTDRGNRLHDNRIELAAKVSSGAKVAASRKNKEVKRRQTKGDLGENETVTPSPILYVTAVTARSDFTRTRATAENAGQNAVEKADEKAGDNAVEKAGDNAVEKAGDNAVEKAGDNVGDSAENIGTNLATSLKGGHAIISNGEISEWQEIELPGVGPYGGQTTEIPGGSTTGAYDKLKQGIETKAKALGLRSQTTQTTDETQTTQTTDETQTTQTTDETQTTQTTGEGGQDADTIQASVKMNPPLLTFAFPRPTQLGTITVDKPQSDHPGVRLGKAVLDFENRDKKGLQFKGGTMGVAVAMGELAESKGARAVKLKKAKEAPLAADAFHATAEKQNEFPGMSSKLDRFLAERVTTTGDLTDEGAHAEIKVSKGKLGSSGLMLQESTLSASMGKNGPSLEGSVGISDEQEKISGRLDLGWSGAGLTVAGSATVKDVIDGLDPFTATVTHQSGADSPDALGLHVDRVAYQRTVSGVALTGEARNLNYDFKAGAFAGEAELGVELGALGAVHATARIADNRLQQAELVYDSPSLAFPRSNPIFAGNLYSKLVYKDEAISGRVGGTADLALPGLQQLGQDGPPIRLSVDAGIADNGAVSGTLELVQPVQFSPYFQVTRMSAGFDESGQISFTGAMALDSGVFSPAEVEIAYDKGKLSGAGTVGIAKGKIMGVDAASVSLAVSDDGVAGSGTITPTLKQIKEGQISASYSKERGMSFGGGLTLGDIPYVKGAALDFRVGKRPGAKDYDVSADGGFTIAIPGLTAQGHASYDNGAFTIEGSAGFKRGLAQGTVSVGVTNRVVDEKGRIGTAIGDHLSPYGKGSLSVRLTPWLAGKAGVRLLPNGELIVDGGLALAKPVTLFDQRKFAQKIFSIDIDIPILGLSVAGQRVGIFATVGGGMDMDASVGPGEISSGKLHIVYNPSRPDDTELSGSARLHVPAQAGIRLAIRGALGAGIPIVSASLGLEASGRMGVVGALDAGIDLAWSAAKGLNFDAFGAVSAQPKLRFELKGFAKVEADLVLKTIELYRKEWLLAAFEYGPAMSLGMKFPMHYDAKNGFQMPWDKVEFKKPTVNTKQLLTGLVDKVK